ncbi:MAG: phenylalanine--tRNA ligase subunit beta [Flavobacteriaceae bacterium]|jgi:phenylalanyl-tRNA synthetase beta chain|nr:phenylalanine--tRNA ligase subunit beta [Flavobacteriaceae bacterium]MBT4112467.1 phenylalanine--tRNA ligase subunit beta [Flavobacteriaceae bacterium]MBT4614321.1 phenylalanine--tRNA ligase subunit beta [Flavobacteriaceae bacterium]MBT5246774.1 phenylalanine--tRNA ligase subunit beta [Flavobacteriaceae bacterium]MBT5649959.1 phenylalanine--tRNA ligase subunit beta [Flavobacteriaceae bacterium]
MKISYNWLKQFLNLKDTVEDTADMLTELGLEVEDILDFKSIKGGLKGVVIGKVRTCKKHPNADRLKITTVSIGLNKDVQIICGAPNVDLNQTVAVATAGTKIYSNDDCWTIQKSKIRGEISDGMICGEDELGLGDSHEGIMLLDKKYEAGTPLDTIFKIESDKILEIGLTPNRSDAISHYGTARDLRAGLLQRGMKLELMKPSISDFIIDKKLVNIKLEVENNLLAPRYCGIVIDDIVVQESPQWLINRLKSIDVTPINNIVDITNYVLHDIGQPLHAFDYNKIHENKISVKTLKNGTKFTALDGIERKLTSNDLMICSGNKPLCLAGIYGGLDSGITEKTTSIFLESAYFDPITIRKSSKYHGLNTDASYRFERGVDPNITDLALKRACILIKQICKNSMVSSDITDVYPKRIEEKQIIISFKNIENLIGKKIDREIIKRIITSLDIKIESITESNLGISIPAYRNDVTREADVIEEILRIYGYNNIESSKKINRSLILHDQLSKNDIENIIANHLVSLGFSEIITNSLTSPKFNKANKNIKESLHVSVINSSSSDLSSLRNSLMFSGIEALSYNINRKQSNLKMFEFGKDYIKNNNKYIEEEKLCLFITGNKSSKNWNKTLHKSDFYYVKGVVSSIIDRLNLSKANSKPTIDKNLKDGETLILNDKPLVSFGFISQNSLDVFDIEQEVYYVEFNWGNVLGSINKGPVLFQEIPKFPEVSRDLSILIDEDISFESIYNSAYKANKNLIKNISLFDVYIGNNIPKNKKSYGLNFKISDKSKTLSDNEIDHLMKNVTNNLIKEFGAELR